MEDDDSGLRPRRVAGPFRIVALDLSSPLERCDDNEARAITLRMLRTTFSGNKEVKKSQSEGRLTAMRDMPASSIAK